MESTQSSKQTRFVNWLTENNARFPKLEFRNDVQGCGSVYCSEDIAEDEVFLFVPFTPLVLTDTLARQQLPTSVQSLDGRTALILFLIQQDLLKDASFFQPYLDMIPDRIHTALEFDDQDMEQLRGTNAFQTVKHLKDKLEQKYKETMAIVGKELRQEDGYTWEKFLWAETVLSSRAFPAHLFGGGVEGETVLIPLGDTLNHKSRHKATWIKTPGGLQMSGSAIKQGHQVFNNYGPKSNEELLVGYGFCTEDNMDDLVTLKTNFSQDPDQERKSAILRYIGVSEKTLHYLRHDSIPDQLLATMRVMAMNPSEVDRCNEVIEQSELAHNSLEQNEEAIALALKRELSFMNTRNEFAMLDLMDLLMGVKLQSLLEWDAKLSAPKNQAQEFAQIYRRGQKQILETCSDICRGMFSVLLDECCSASFPTEQAVFLGATTDGQSASLSTQRRIQNQDAYTLEFYKAAALRESRTMSELKRDAVRQTLMTARGIMIEHKDDTFGEALSCAFPGHGWGDETWGGDDEEEDEEEAMAIQMEQDAILTCYLVFESQRPDRFRKFITAAMKFDYSSQLDEDMMEDVEDLRQSLQETLEEVDPNVFDFDTTFTPQAFVWSTGLLEALSLSFHINNEIVSGILAPRDPEHASTTDGSGHKRKHE
ncbi:hypothetical protein BGX26_008572 [Mortierella sp. AD094]|nr:hypothetical protein BGX26_008572 [Mortierella sp. AD094]